MRKLEKHPAKRPRPDPREAQPAKGKKGKGKGKKVQQLPRHLVQGAREKQLHGSGPSHGSHGQAVSPAESGNLRREHAGEVQSNPGKHRGGGEAWETKKKQHRNVAVNKTFACCFSACFSAQIHFRSVLCCLCWFVITVDIRKGKVVRRAILKPVCIKQTSKTVITQSKEGPR